MMGYTMLKRCLWSLEWLEMALRIHLRCSVRTPTTGSRIGQTSSPSSSFVANANTRFVEIRHFVIELISVKLQVHVVVLIVTLFWHTSHARPSTSTTSLTSQVTCKSISSSKFSTTTRADMRSFTRMKLLMTFQIVQSSKSALTSLTLKRLLVGVCQQM